MKSKLINWEEEEEEEEEEELLLGVVTPPAVLPSSQIQPKKPQDQKTWNQHQPASISIHQHLLAASCSVAGCIYRMFWIGIQVAAVRATETWN